MSGRKYTFRDRATTQKLAGLVRDPTSQLHNATQYASDYQGQSWIVKTPESGIPKFEAGQPGSAMCEPYFIDSNGAMVLQTTNDGQPGSVEVFNLDQVAIAADQYIGAWVVGNRAVVRVGAETFGKPVPWLRFTTFTKMAGRKVDATIDIIRGNVKNPNNENEPYVPGDSITITDRNNLWADVEAGATGTAYFRVDDTLEPPDDEVGDFEISNCTQPINELVVQIEECIHPDSGATTGTFILGDALRRFTHGNVDIPPEFTPAGPDTYEVQFFNSARLDAHPDGDVTIRRVQVKNASDPFFTSDPEGSGTNPQWELASRELQIARWAQFTKSSGGTWDYTGPFWDGGNPTTCTPLPIGECLFPDPCECAEPGTKGVGFYDPANKKYMISVTESALLGAPKDLKTASAFNFTSCGVLNWTENTFKGWECPPNPTPKSTTLPTYDIEIVVETRLENGSICVAYEMITVLDCGVGGDPNEYCDDLCAQLCYCYEPYSLPEYCDPPPPCEFCTWEWSDAANGGTGGWINPIDECGEGCICGPPPPIPVPPPADGALVEFECRKIDPPGDGCQLYHTSVSRNEEGDRLCDLDPTGCWELARYVGTSDCVDFEGNPDECHWYELCCCEDTCGELNDQRWVLGSAEQGGMPPNDRIGGNILCDIDEMCNAPNCNGCTTQGGGGGDSCQPPPPA